MNSERWKPERTSLLGIIGGLMLAEHLGDVHDELLMLCDIAGIPRLTGNYIDGWSVDDLVSVWMDDE